MSEGKKKSTAKGKPDDWSFKVADEDLEHVQMKKKTTRASGATPSMTSLKKTTKKKRELGVEAPHKKRISRSALAKRDAALSAYADMMPPEIYKRVMATVIDYGLVAGFAFGLKLLIPTIEYHYVKVLAQQGMNQTLPPDELHTLLVGVPLFILFILFLVIPSSLFYKTPGKSMMDMRIGHKDIGDRPSRFMLFLRELIFKPLSIVSVIGVLLGLKGEWKRTLHDYICQTSLYIDD